MQFDNWNFWINALQGHPTHCKHGHINVFVKLIKEIFSDTGKILVVGCGEGLEVKVLKDIGFDPVGITLGESNLRYAKETFSDYDIRIMEMHCLNFPPDFFDYVISIHNFEHSFAPMIHCLEVNNALKQNGLWFIAMPEYKYDILLEQGLSHHHPNLIPDEVYEQIFLTCGFQIIDKFLSRKDDYYRENSWLLKKTNKYIHSDVKSALEQRRNY